MSGRKERTASSFGPAGAGAAGAGVAGAVGAGASDAAPAASSTTRHVADARTRPHRTTTNLLGQVATITRHAWRAARPC
ncbi:MAG: hypothetical protein AMS14_00770 [Planctomycetes bacterium DG_20]|nr:MAG: hypothetical protein AMS14_00770 [Planctomycetes bacterium DG_20]